MRPSLNNRICARPYAIASTIGTLALWTVFTRYLIAENILQAAIKSPTIILLLTFCLLPLCGLGCIIGTMFIGPFTTKICSRVNGAPHLIGDNVIILSGTNYGKIAKIYKTGRNQGGAVVYHVDLGKDAAKKFSDCYESYDLLRTPPEPPQANQIRY